MTEQELDLQLEKLNVQSGDVLVLRCDEDSASDTYEMSLRLQAAFNRQGVDRVLLCVLTPGASLEHLDEEAMNSHGWIRAPESP